MKKAKSMKERVQGFANEASVQGETGTVTLLTRVPKRLRKVLRLYTVQNETTVQKFVTEVLEKALKEKGAL
jgi:hypothetical protein